MTDKQRKMFGLVEAWERSGLKQGAFCQQQVIHPAIFSYKRGKDLVNGYLWRTAKYYTLGADLVHRSTSPSQSPKRFELHPVAST